MTYCSAFTLGYLIGREKKGSDFKKDAFHFISFTFFILISNLFYNLYINE